MSANLRLGLDIGGTASRWVVCDEDGHEVARGSAPGATGHAFNPAERARLQSVFGAIAADLSARDLHIAEIVAGVTGYGASVEPVITKILLENFGPARVALLADDMRLAYAAVFTPGEGYLVSAGTGSIGLFVDQRDDSVRVGGRGILIDDAGSGSWIALRAIDRLFRHLDRTGGTDFRMTPLGAHLADSIGGADWSAVREFVYGGDRGRIGKLARAVGQAAYEGDMLALAVLQDAGKELAALALALEGRKGMRPIALIGGVLRLHPIVKEAFETPLSGRTLSYPAPDVALFAARLLTPLGAAWAHIA